MHEPLSFCEKAMFSQGKMPIKKHGQPKEMGAVRAAVSLPAAGVPGIGPFLSVRPGRTVHAGARIKRKKHTCPTDRCVFRHPVKRDTVSASRAYRKKSAPMPTGKSSLSFKARWIFASIRADSPMSHKKNHPYTVQKCTGAFFKRPWDKLNFFNSSHTQPNNGTLPNTSGR